MPDRAGGKMTLTDSGVILFKILSAIPRLFANRPTVVDPRVDEVRSLTRKASYTHQRAMITVHQESQIRKGL